MEWLWLICAAITGLLVGTFGGVRLGVASMRPVIGELSFNAADGRNRTLMSLRCELANRMLRRDPEAFLHTSKKAHDADTHFSAADAKVQRAQLAELTKRYRDYESFGLLGTREHVLYADALGINSYDEVERQYLDIVRPQSLNIALDKNWRKAAFKGHATSDEDLAHLEKYSLQLKDTRFKHRLQGAIMEYFVYRRGVEDGCSSAASEAAVECESAIFSVRPVRHFAERFYGVHFNDTGEIGLYTAFNDGVDREFRNFYRCDADFENDTIIDDPRIDDVV